MAIDKELFYASHDLKYPVVARPYTDDYMVTKKMYTEDDVVAMLDKIKSRIEALHSPISGNDFGYGYISGFVDSSKIVQEQINSLKENEDGKK